MALLSAAYILSACAITIDQNRLYKKDMAQPRPGTLAAPDGYTLDDRIIALPELGHLHVVRLDNPKTDAVIIFSGGRTNFVALQSVRMRRLAKATGMDIILYDYPGRGGTDIPLSTENTLATGPALIKKATELGWINGAALYAYGFSFGGGQAAGMVRNGGFDGIIIEGSAPDVKGIGRDYLPGIIKPFITVRVDEDIIRFGYYDNVRNARAPVLLISNLQDKVVRTKRVEAFYEKLKADGVPVQIVKVPGGHGGGLQNTKVQQAIRTFATRR